MTNKQQREGSAFIPRKLAVAQAWWKLESSAGVLIAVIPSVPEKQKWPMTSPAVRPGHCLLQSARYLAPPGSGALVQAASHSFSGCLSQSGPLLHWPRPGICSRWAIRIATLCSIHDIHGRIHQNVLDNQGFWSKEPKEASKSIHNMYKTTDYNLDCWYEYSRWLILDSSKCPNDQVPKQLLAPAAKDVAAALLRASTGPSKSLTRLGIQLVQLARCQTL